MTDYHVIRPSQAVRLAEQTAPEDGSFRHRLTFEEGRLEDVPELVWRWPLDGPAEDWVGTDDMTRLVSPRVRDAIDGALGVEDAVQWIPATLTMPEGAPLDYWVMHFPVWHDVLHATHTNFGPSGLPIRWVLDRAKLDGHSVFIVPQLNDITIVNDHVLAALRAMRATGLAVEPARMA